MTPTRIVIIGAGAAGLIAAAEAARRSASVVLLEKNSKTGVKILMSGGTRCNLTHDTDAKGILPGFGHASRFLRHSVGAFSPPDVVKMFNRLGVSTKVESTGKVFPQSDRAIHVRDALQAQALEAGGNILRATPAIGLSRGDHGWRVKTEKETLEADRVIVTAGGRSWPGCGTTGDAYEWLTQLGHTIVETRPALVPLTGGFKWMNELSGVTLEDCSITATNQTIDGRTTTQHSMSRRSSCLFTHFGFSGPAPMDISRVVTLDESRKHLKVTLDFVPEFPLEKIESMLLGMAAKSGRRRVSAVLSDWLPNRLASSIANETCNDTMIAELSKAARQKLLMGLKSLQLPISGTRGFNKAEVTAGGVSLDEVNPRTMESRKASGLFIAGEVLDVDGWIGGYNFQAAFSTGRAAGIAAATR